MAVDSEALKPFAARYIWWKTPDDAVTRPERVIAQVMDIGDFEDMQAVARLVGDEALRRVLTEAEAGQFRPRSWAYWHCRLGMADGDELPPLPVRRFS
jgi:hypothetical protein